MDACSRWSTNTYLYNKWGERQQYTVSVRPITGNLENTADVTYFFISLIIVKNEPNNRNRIVPKKGYLKAKDRILRKNLDENDKNAPSSHSYGFGSPTMPNYILSHTSSFKSAWTWFILVLTLYTAVMVPYSVAFQYKGAAKHRIGYFISYKNYWLKVSSWKTPSWYTLGYLFVMNKNYFGKIFNNIT